MSLFGEQRVTTGTIGGKHNARSRAMLEYGRAWVWFEENDTIWCGSALVEEWGFTLPKITDDSVMWSARCIVDDGFVAYLGVGKPAGFHLTNVTESIQRKI